MADKVSRFAPTGSMDKDSDPRYVGKGDSNGDYIDARNIQCVPQDGNENGTISPTLGNEFAFSLGSVSQQNKRYRIVLDGDPLKQHELRFLSTQRDADMVTPNGPNGGLMFNGTVTSFTTAFNNAISGSGVSWVLSTSTPGAVEIELQEYPMYQWYIESVGADVINPVVIAEAIPVDLAGPLKDIGSYDLLGDLFIFSTTQDNEPTELSAQIIGVGLTTPLTSLLFNAAHGLVAGQWIRISNSTAPWLSGLFVVSQVISTVEIAIPTVYAWGGAPVSFVVGQEVVYSSPSGIGEIGVAQKNENTNSWAYIRLLRSVEFNFISKWQIDCDAEKNRERTSFYFDDDYNSFKKFYYSGDFLTDGALSPPNLYQYDNIERQLRGTSSSPNIYIDLDSQIDNGGSLPASNIRYFIVLEDVFGNISTPTELTQHVICYTDSNDGVAIGDADGEITSKVNVLRVSGIDNVLYKRIAVGYLYQTGGVIAAWLNEYIPITGVEMLIEHTGYEVKTTYDVGLLSVSNEAPYDYAKNIRILDGRLVRSNLRKENSKDIAGFFKTFKHRICVEKIDESIHTFSSVPGGYKDPANVFYKMGYMHNETYRMAGRLRLINGAKTEWFWIDDIRINPYLINESNPLDDRRDQTGPDLCTTFDLTEPIPGTFPIERKILVPYIDFFGFDLSYSVGTKSIYEITESIEIGRAEVVPEVMATGFAIMSVRIKTNEEVPDPPGINFDENPLLGVRRGLRITGRIDPGSTIASIDHGIGVREEDRILTPASDVSDTLHEYMFAYGGPFTGLSNVPGNSLTLPFYANENYNLYSIPASTNLDGLNYPTIFSYPTTNGVDFYWNEFSKIEIQISTQVVYGYNSYSYLYQQGLRSERRVVSVYIPDSLHSGIDFSSREIIDFGEVYFDNASVVSSLHRDVVIDAMASGIIAYHAENLGTTFNTYTIDKLKYIDEGERENMFGQNIGFRKAFDHYHIAGDVSNQYTKGAHPGLWLVKKSAVAYIENSGIGIADTGKNTDYGVRYVQLFTRKNDKYGPPSETDYYTTNSYLKMSSTPSTIIPQGTLNVFGGDTFTQESNIKTVRANEAFATTITGGNPSWPLPFSLYEGPGLCKGMVMYSQNRYNSQLRHTDINQYVFLRDQPDGPLWANSWDRPDIDTLSGSYSMLNRLFSQPTGNYIFGKNTYDYPQRIHWSERNLYGQVVDDFLSFQLINIKDLDLRFGEIHHHEVVNGELFTLQERKWQSQLFNTRGELQVSGSAIGAIIGDGSVMSRDGQTLSRYGTQNKWSCYLGTTDGGKDALYWYNSENGLFMRFGADGTIVISNRNRLRAFSNKVAKWMIGKDTPAYDQGIRCVWDDRSKEVVWTFTGWRELPEWAAMFTEAGETVKNSNAPSDSYEGFPRFFKCKLVHIGSSLTEPGVGADWETYWEQISYDDQNYYSIFTLAFNEATNGFSTFYDHIPKTYLKWRDTFLSSHPTQRNLIFEHRKGDPTTWYGVDSFLTGTIAPKIEDAYIEAVINDLPEESKRFISAEILSENVPDRIEYRTKSQYTWSEPADFKVNDDQFRGFILNDATVSQDPRGNTRRMDGDYIKAKFFFIGGTMNKLYSMVVKLRGRLRDFRQ